LKRTNFQGLDAISSYLNIPLDPYLGIINAIAVAGFWFLSLFVALQFDPTHLSPWLVFLIILVRTFLHTGLFIVAHDAAHGTVAPQSQVWNHRLGNLAISLYALLPYHKFLKNHHLHHALPAQTDDPDFHAPGRSHPVTWYMEFMATYLDRAQVIRFLIFFTIIFHGLRLGLHIPGLSLVMFWVLPILLSSMQLFYFGTYLPHRMPLQGYQNPHHATSSNFDTLWSFLTCYHFGYHWEHHEYPHLPWFKLPLAR
jgi:beta-carotene/zeaxanthin 4-ketolase